jgi:hypothetical protein
MADIFISYSNKDQELARKVFCALESHGYTLWWDQRLTPQESWDLTIEVEIKRATVVLVLWTSRSVTSEWVRSEADYAKSQDKLVSAILQECELPLAYRLRQAASLVRWNGDTNASEWMRLVSWISILAGELLKPLPSTINRGGGASVPDEVLTAATAYISENAKLPDVERIQDQKNDNSDKNEESPTIDSAQPGISMWFAMPLDTAVWIAVFTLYLPRDSIFILSPRLPAAPIVKLVTVISRRVVGDGDMPSISFSELQLISLIILLSYFFLSSSVLRVSSRSGGSSNYYPLVDLIILLALALLAGSVLIAFAFFVPYFNWIGLPLLLVVLASILASILLPPTSKPQVQRLIFAIVSSVPAMTLLAWSLILSKKIA